MKTGSEAPADYIETHGMPFLAHLLRRVSDRMVAEASGYFTSRGIVAPARTASTLLLLNEQGPQSVTALAQKLRQSHPLMITWIRQLRKLGLVNLAPDPDDARRTLISLTAGGRQEAKRMAKALAVLGRAYEAVLAEAEVDAFAGLRRLDTLIKNGRLAQCLHELGA